MCIRDSPIPVEWLAGWLNQPIDAPVVQVITGTVGIVMTVLLSLIHISEPTRPY